MKKIPFFLLGVTAASLGAAPELAPEPSQTAPAMRRQFRGGPPGEAPSPERMTRAPLPPPTKREKVAYLGVAVSPTAPSLTAQLQLAPHTGLVVGSVAGDSPASDAIKLHDVLVELDGQLLINPEQFAVLVHNHRAGDELTLKLIRAGKPASIKVKLSEREGHVGNPEPKPHRPMPPRPGVSFPGGIPVPGQPGVIERQLELQRQGAPGPESRVRQRRVVVRDEAGSIELQISAEGRQVTVKTPDGATVFSGPLNSPADHQAIPETIRQRLHQLPEARGLTLPEERR